MLKGANQQHWESYQSLKDMPGIAKKNNFRATVAQIVMAINEPQSKRALQEAHTLEPAPEGTALHKIES